jgi:hypothetical protein
MNGTRKMAVIYTAQNGRNFKTWHEDSEDLEDILKHIEFEYNEIEIIGVVAWEKANEWLAAEYGKAPDPAQESDSDEDTNENLRGLGGDMETINNGAKNMRPERAWKAFKEKSLCEYFYEEAKRQGYKFYIDAAAEAFHIVEQHFWDIVTATEGGAA